MKVHNAVADENIMWITLNKYISARLDTDYY